MYVYFFMFLIKKFINLSFLYILVKKNTFVSFLNTGFNYDSFHLLIENHLIFSFQKLDIFNKN